MKTKLKIIGIFAVTATLVSVAYFKYATPNYNYSLFFEDDPVGKNLSLKVLVEDYHPELVGEIEAIYSEKGNDIKIGIKHLPTTSKGIVTMEVWPSQFTEKLPYSQGNYNLEICEKLACDEYAIDISEDKIEVESRKSTFTNIRGEKEITRFTSDMFFAECRYRGYKWYLNPYVDHCKNFFDEIEGVAEPYFATTEDQEFTRQFYTLKGQPTELNKIRDKYFKEDDDFDFGVYSAHGLFGSKATAIPNMELVYTQNVEDVSLCRQNEDVYDSMCFFKAAFYTQDESICEQMGAAAAQCYSYIALAKKDEKMCVEKSAECNSCKGECINEIRRYKAGQIDKNTPLSRVSE